MLFSAYPMGNITLTNRIVMAPMTRSRSHQPGNVPSEMNALYYAQRASAGLIVSEGAQITPEGQGYPWTPGIHSKEQIEGWRKVSDAVHAKGGKIFLQLWHVGRISHPLIQPEGKTPVAPSPIRPSGEVFVIGTDGQPAMLPFETPRALSMDEIRIITEDYVQAARNALNAGMDGVEIHAANGYLLDQFLNSSTNQRTDAYGGSIENRIRLVLEVTDAVGKVCGTNQTGVRISPFGTFNDMGDEDPLQLFSSLATALNERNLAYLHVVDPTYLTTPGEKNAEGSALIQKIRARFKGTLILCGDYDGRKAEAALASGDANLIGFGRPFIANPDLPERLAANATIKVADPATFYGGSVLGYVDYPSLRQEQGLEPATDLSRFE